MKTEVFEGEYIIDDKVFDDIYVFLDIESYLYRGIEETGFGENRKLDYLVNMQNRALMVLESNEILFGMKMTELTKDINNKANTTVYRYSPEIEIHIPEYEIILEFIKHLAFSSLYQTRSAIFDLFVKFFLSFLKLKALPAKLVTLTRLVGGTFVILVKILQVS